MVDPLRVISRTGKVMVDPFGNKRMCYTPLSMYIVDYPEAIRLAGVTSCHSSVTIAKPSQLGNGIRYRRRWLSGTKRTIELLKREIDPVHEIGEFAKAAFERGLTGVTDLFWDGWANSEPSSALTFDLLHSGHKYWSDHILKWCVKALGSTEINRRFKAIPQRIGFRHFRNGITTLKKTNCRDFRDMQRFIMPVLDGGVDSRFSKLVRIHLDYHYLAQSVEVSEDETRQIQELLQQFNDKKEIVNILKLRETKKKKRPKGFRIPKLELQQHIVPSILGTGNLQGSSTDTTEKGHGEFVKGPYRLTNHKDPYPQMTNRLDKLETVRNFDLVTGLDALEKSISSLGESLVEGAANSLHLLNTVENLQGTMDEEPADYFAIIKGLERLRHEGERVRNRTFSTHSFTAIHLNRDPDISSITIDQAAREFRIPDLHDAILGYYTQPQGNQQMRCVLRRGTRVGSRSCNIPFNRVKVWFNIRIQTRSLANPGTVNGPQTLFALPKTTERGGWPKGRHDCALFINDIEKEFSGKADLRGNYFMHHFIAELTGLNALDHCVGQLRLIFQGVADGNLFDNSSYLVYATGFEAVRADSRADSRSGLVRLKRTLTGEGHRIGTVVEATRIRAPVSVVPFFGKDIHERLTSKNSMEGSLLFNLNKYADKEDFLLLHDLESYR